MANDENRWKDRLRAQIERAAEEVRTAAFDVITASPLIAAATITIRLDPDTFETVNYDIDVLPRGLRDK